MNTESFTLEDLQRRAEQCRNCDLAAARTHLVFGTGSPTAKIVLVGEGPGEQEDRQGLPFVGPAGKLLDIMLEIIHLDRSRVYICNIVKCRPPYNRVPTPEEAEACRIHLRIQTWLVRPRVIVLLGSTAARNVLDPEIRIMRERGRWTERKGVWMMPTYHPSALLRDPGKKREAWEDMKSLRHKLIELGLYRDIYSMSTGGPGPDPEDAGRDAFTEGSYG